MPAGAGQPAKTRAKAETKDAGGEKAASR